MTTKRAVESRVETLEGAQGDASDAYTLLVPPCALPEDREPQPDGELTVTRDGTDEVVVPHHLPRRLRRTGGIPLLSYRQVLLSWVFMSDDVLHREIEMRQDRDEPIPPIVPDRYTGGGA